MSYDPNIPSPESSPISSVSQIQTNFAQFASIFSNLNGIFYNHVAFSNTDSAQGKHGAVIFENQSSDPGVIQSLDVLYSKDASSRSGTQPQLFIQIPQVLPTNIDKNPATNAPMQLTYNSVGMAGPIYYSFLPGGYLIYFGSAVTAGAPPNGTVTITLSPVPTFIISVQAVPTGTGNAANGGATRTNVPFDSWVIVNQALSTIQINSQRATAGSTFLWMAVCKA